MTCNHRIFPRADFVPFWMPVILLMLAGAVAAQPALTKERSPLRWHARFGLGYETVSQGFYVATADTTDPVSQTALETTVLDDVKGIAAIGFDWHFLTTELGLDQTSELWRGRFRSEWQLRGRSGSIRLQGNLDRRGRVRGAAAVGDEYWLGQFRLRGELAAGEQNSFFLHTAAEAYQFDRTAGSTQSTQTYAIRAGYTRQFGLLSSLSLAPYFQRRNVPDSGLLNYRTIGFETDLFYLTDGIDLDADLRLEDRQYDNSSRPGSYLLLDGSTRLSSNLTRSMLLRSRLESQLYVYRHADTSNADFWKVETHHYLGVAFGQVELAAGPFLGWLIQPSDSLAIREDYFESGAGGSIVLLPSLRGSMELETILSYRNISFPSEILSDFWKLHVSLIGDRTLIGSSSVSLYVTAEWEWHHDRAENSRLYLASGGLAYRL